MRPDIRGLTHDHIDGSMAMRDIILDLYKLAGKPFPFPSVGQWLAYFQNPHEDMVAKFGTVTGVLQTREALEMAGYAYGKRRAEEGYLYVEGKFAPQYHVYGGMTTRTAIHAVRTGLRRAEQQFGIVCMLVVAIGREATPDQGESIARAVLNFGGEVALDLACDEAGNPPEKHLPAYRLTFGTSVRRDCHAGEWVAGEPAETYRARLLTNVRTAIDTLKSHSVGHAIPLIDDPELVKMVADKGIRIAGCPLSNLACGKIASVRELGIDRLLDAGVLYTMSPDDDLFLPPLREVITACDDAYGFTEAQCRKLEENVFRGALDRRVRTG